MHLEEKLSIATRDSYSQKDTQFENSNFIAFKFVCYPSGYSKETLVWKDMKNNRE